MAWRPHGRGRPALRVPHVRGLRHGTRQWPVRLGTVRTAVSMQQRDSGATRAPSFGTALRSYRDFGTALAEENGQNGFFQVCPTFLRPTHWSQGGWQSLLAQRHQLGRAEQRARLARRLAVEQRLLSLSLSLSSRLTGVNLILFFSKVRTRKLRHEFVAFAQQPLGEAATIGAMRPTPAEIEVARALIARVKAADPSINGSTSCWCAPQSHVGQT